MSGNTMPICPHCDYQLKDRHVREGSDFDTSDGAQNETQCPCCGRVFTTDVYTVTYFTTRK